MKKIFKIIIAVITLIFCILTLFCIKVDKILLIEKIRDKIVKTEENKKNINIVTLIDVTNLEDDRKYTTCSYI